MSHNLSVDCCSEKDIIIPDNNSIIRKAIMKHSGMAVTIKETSFFLNKDGHRKDELLSKFVKEVVIDFIPFVLIVYVYETDLYINFNHRSLAGLP